MPVLSTRNMDAVKTGAELMPEQKKVQAKVVPPFDKDKEVYNDPDGRFTIAKFSVQLTEGEFKGRTTGMSFFVNVAKDTYITWNLKDEGRPLTTAEKEQMWEDGVYLKDLKRFLNAIDLVVETGTEGVKFNTEDAYGKELLVDIKQSENKQTGDLFNEAKNPRKIR